MPHTPARRPSSPPPEVGRLVRLHHRRRGWAWVAISSAAGLAVYAGVDMGRPGTTGTLGAIPALVLLALMMAGLVVVSADTTRIHRTDAAVRGQAKGQVSHHPVYA